MVILFAGNSGTLKDAVILLAGSSGTLKDAVILLAGSSGTPKDAVILFAGSSEIQNDMSFYLPETLRRKTTLEQQIFATRTRCTQKLCTFAAYKTKHIVS